MLPQGEHHWQLSGAALWWSTVACSLWLSDMGLLRQSM